MLIFHPCLGDEVAQLEVLEGQCRAAQDKFKNKRRSVRQMEEDMQVGTYTCTCTCMLHQGRSQAIWWVGSLRTKSRLSFGYLES